ncbi:DELLA protein rgl3 [Sorochytrium milnesiophthora]
MLAKRFLQEAAANSSSVSSHYQRPEPTRDITPSIVGDRIQQLREKLNLDGVDLQQTGSLKSSRTASIASLKSAASASASQELASSPTLVASSSNVSNVLVPADKDVSSKAGDSPHRPPGKLGGLVDMLRRSPSPTKCSSTPATDAPKTSSRPYSVPCMSAIAADAAAPVVKVKRRTLVRKSAIKRRSIGDERCLAAVQAGADQHRRAKSAATVAPLPVSPTKLPESPPARSSSPTRATLRRFSHLLQRSAANDEDSASPTAALWLKLSVTQIAEYITMLDAKVWVRITDQIRSGDNLTASLEMMSDRFNCVTQAIASLFSPAAGSDARTRTLLFEKFVRIAEKALEIHNYALLVAVVAALSHVSQKELHVCRSELRTFDKLVQLTTPCKNYSLLRQHTLEAVQCDLPVVPFAVPYIRDLIHLQEVYKMSDGTASPYDTEAEQSLAAFLDSNLTVFDYYVEPDTRDAMRTLL